MDEDELPPGPSPPLLRSADSWQQFTRANYEIIKQWLARQDRPNSNTDVMTALSSFWPDYHTQR